MLERLFSRPSSGTGSRIVPLICVPLSFFAGVAYCLRFRPDVRPFAIDNQIYFFMAERVASGVPPHISMVDHKNALSSLVSGLAIAIGRWLDLDDATSVRIVSCAATGATVAAVWLLTWRLRGRQIDAHVAALSMFVFVDFFVQGSQGVRPKLFMAMFMSVGLAAHAAGHLFRSGLLSISAFLCWQPALLVPACLGVSTLLEPPRVQRALRFGGAALLAIVAYELYFVIHGAIGEQLYQTYVMPTREEAWPVPPLAKSFDFLWRLGHPRQDWSFVLPINFMAALAALAIACIVRPATVLRRLAASSAWSGVVASGAAAWAFTMVNHQAYPDLFFLYPFFAVAAGITVGLIVELLGRIRPAALATAARTAAVILLAGAVAHIAWSRRTIYRIGGNLNLNDQRALASVVKGFETAGDRVWAIGCVHLLALERMPNFLPYGLLIDPNIRAYMLSKAGGGPFIPLNANDELPTKILVARGGERRVMPWLPRLYSKVTDEAFARQGISMWALRTDADIARVLEIIRQAQLR